jgi:hypothetical protein
MRYTRKDFCQGHGGGRDCTYAPEVDGCLQHGDDFDHGVISYCDGTCTESQEHYLRYLRVELGQEPVAPVESITLDVYFPGRASYRVTFEGLAAEPRALTYVAARPSVYFNEVYDAPVHPSFVALKKVLYPTCHHSLSLQLCMDPYSDAHFGTREQELANGW